MKKILAILMAVAIMATCAVAMADAPKIGITIYQFADNFMTLYREELVNYLTNECGIPAENITVLDGKNDQVEQTNQIDGFIADNVDVMILNLVQSSSAASVIQKADAAGIPVVFINREPSAEDMELNGNFCYVGADARQSGTMQGNIVLATESKGDLNGNGQVDYVMIMGDPENVDAQYRTEFSIKALEDAGLSVNKLFEQRGDWDQAKGQELAANALTQFGDEVDVIFCNNDAMALGAAQAITAAGRTVGQDIYLVGVDALEEAVEMVNNGTMTGTVLNDAEGQASQAAECVKVFVEGGLCEDDGDKNYTVDYVKVTG